jgi:hypothetical protein
MRRRMLLAPPSAGAVLVVSDSFNRADGALGNADTGQAWANIGANGLLIVSNQAAASNGSSNNNVSIPVGVSDMRVELTTVSGSLSGVGPLARYVDTSHFVRTILGNSWSINEVGGAGVIASGTTTWNNGDRARLDVVGLTASLYQNGVLLGSGTLLNAVGTSAGIWIGPTISARVDDFKAYALG